MGSSPTASVILSKKGGKMKILLTFVVALFLSQVALAATSQISLDQVDPSFGESITFTVSTNRTDNPFVNLRCYQGSNFVYDGWRGGVVNDPFVLSAPGYWTGGQADCVARLVSWDHGRQKTLETMEFHVYE